MVHKTSSPSPTQPPAWAQCCANPLKPYSGTPWPAYPGHAVSSLSQWKAECLGPLPQFGNCAYAYYASHPGGPETTTSCGQAKDVKIEASTAHKGTVCFDNPKAPSSNPDRLCIFTDFMEGNVNAEQMNPGTRQQSLEKLFQSFSDENQMGLQGKTFCLHHGDQASVGWTHMHSFNTSGTWPDGLSAKTAYCVPWKGTVQGTASAMEACLMAGPNNTQACV